MQLRAELGARVLEVFQSGSSLQQVDRAAEWLCLWNRSTHESEVTHTTQLKKSTRLRRPLPQHLGKQGVWWVCVLLCPVTNTSLREGLMSGSPVSRSLVGIAYSVSHNEVSLVLPTKVSIKRQLVFQARHLLFCRFWWCTLLALFLHHFCCVNSSMAVVSKGHLITIPNFILNE